MTPEITWTDTGPGQREAWHMGRQWLLFRRLRESNGNAAGWYLYATLAPGVVDDHGRWMGTRAVRAQEKATALLLSPEGREMAGIADREAAITE